MIHGFIDDICDILGIDAPIISYDTSHFSTETMMAQVDSDGKYIFLRKKERPDPDDFFAVCHELRHIWQLRTDRDRFFNGYKTADLCGSLAEYNRQEAELDANAFAGLTMEIFFGLSPQFQGMPDDIKILIFSRMDSEEMQELFDK